MSEEKCSYCRGQCESKSAFRFLGYTVQGKLRDTKTTLCPSCAANYSISWVCEKCGKRAVSGTVYCKCGRVKKHSFHYREYHSRSSPRFKGDREIRFGLELEVCGRFEPQALALTQAGFTEKSIFAEHDCSVDVEWITRPLTAAEAPGFIRRAVTALAAGGAHTRDNSCGCHHNVDKHALNTEGWTGVCAAIAHSYSELSKFSTKDRHLDNYAVKPQGSTPGAMYRDSNNGNKYSAVAMHKENLIELRLPGMSLDPDQMVTQFKLYSNLVANAGKPGFDYLDFSSAFGPIDDGMSAVLKKLNIAHRVGVGVTTPAIPMAPPPRRRGFWDVRVGDLVRVMTPAEIYRCHGIPVEEQPSLLSFMPRYRQYLGKTMEVTELLTPNFLGKLFPACKEVAVAGVDTSFYTGELAVEYSGDGSIPYAQLPGVEGGPLVLTPPKAHAKAVKSLAVIAALEATREGTGIRASAATPE